MTAITFQRKRELRPTHHRLEATSKNEATILDKNVKKNARYMFNFRILPSKARFTQDTPPSPQKNNVEVWPEHFCSLLNNIDQGGVGGGVTMVPNTQGGSPVCKKEQNS